ncbi:MAG: SET domain-containing protein-lysine N-methyltransferase [Candidatus Hydrogenedentes bacterium]|nr:SET domain-containing protein-lysine N-methyltransferase [Candidatus Hydrogenedentota bacterium]
MNDAHRDASGTANEERPTPLYPAVIPREEHHPTSAQFEVVSTGDERGRALRATVAFRQGERVAQLSGILIRHTTLDTIQISPALHVSDPWFCRFLLHSCDPNLIIEITVMEARATRDIRPGEYLTIDYAATEDVLGSQFHCHCGSPHCRGWMTGRREKPNDAGRAFLEARGQ